MVLLHKPVKANRSLWRLAFLVVAVLALAPLRALAQVPAAPTNLRAEVGADGLIDILWDNPGDSSITGYDWRFRYTVLPTWTPNWILLNNSGANTTGINLPALEVNSTFEFQVRARNANGPGAAASVVSAQPPLPIRPPPPPPSPPPPRGPGPTVPSAPGNLTAVAGNGKVVLNWDTPRSNGGAAITDYEYRIDSAGNRWIAIGSTETTHTVTGLDNGRTYVFVVRAVNRAGRSGASNRAEATPAAPEVVDLSHFANGEGITSELVFVNTGTQPVRPAIYFYDTMGSPIAAEAVVEVAGGVAITEDGALTVVTEMEPLAEFTIATHGQGDLVTGSVTVASEGPLGGMLRFDLPHVGQAVVGAAAVGSGSATSDVIFPVRRRQGGVNTGVAIHNLEPSPELVRCDLMQGGVLRDSATLSLGANGQTSWSIDEAFPGADTSDFAGSVRCDAVGRARFSAIALEMDPGTRNFTTLPVMEVSQSPAANATTLNFAHFANGEGITSELAFVNLETRPSRPPISPFHSAIPPTRPVIYFHDSEGNPMTPETVVDLGAGLEVTEDGGLAVVVEMEPLSELTVATHGRGDLVTGSVKVVSEGPLGGMLRFGLPHIGQAVAGAGAAVSDVIFPVRRRQGGINTGVAIHNLEPSPELVRCDLMQGGALRDSTTLSLGANGQTSWSIDEAFPGADTSDFAGSVRCTSVGAGRFSAAALEMDPGARIFTTLPIVEVEERKSQE